MGSKGEEDPSMTLVECHFYCCYHLSEYRNQGCFLFCKRESEFVLILQAWSCLQLSFLLSPEPSQVRLLTCQLDLPVAMVSQKRLARPFCLKLCLGVSLWNCTFLLWFWLLSVLHKAVIHFYSKFLHCSRIECPKDLVGTGFLRADPC